MGDEVEASRWPDGPLLGTTARVHEDLEPVRAAIAPIGTRSAYFRVPPTAASRDSGLDIRSEKYDAIELRQRRRRNFSFVGRLFMQGQMSLLRNT